MPAVQVADDHVGVDDAFAVEAQHDPEHAVRARVLRTHVDDELVRLEYGISHESFDFLAVLHPQPVHRVLHQQLAGPFERVVLALRDGPASRRASGCAAGPGWPVEPDAEHVEHFALEPVRRRPDAGDGRNRLAVARLHFQPDAMLERNRVQASRSRRTASLAAASRSRSRRSRNRNARRELAQIPRSGDQLIDRQDDRPVADPVRQFGQRLRRTSRCSSVRNDRDRAGPLEGGGSADRPAAASPCRLRHARSTATRARPSSTRTSSRRPG